ncbi:MAG: hypothetical protein P1V97_36675 [Planctomycetota bacterium]|nr:hypothetical protein [Planctomycetota bacterium]
MTKEGLEAPASLNLRRYRFHTGATLRPLESDEPCPVLFRDIGPEAMELYLKGQLTRLAGPLSPITYMRTADYVEPYNDYAAIGRLILLQPLELSPWHSGIAPIFVARSTRMPRAENLAYVPGSLDLKDAEEELMELKSVRELRQALGGQRYDNQVRDSLERLESLNRRHCEVENAGANGIRMNLKSGQTERRERALEQMQALEISEEDLCSAWHHLPIKSRDRLYEIFMEAKMAEGRES